MLTALVLVCIVGVKDADSCSLRVSTQFFATEHCRADVESKIEAGAFREVIPGLGEIDAEDYTCVSWDAVKA